nr:MAG TPA: hypothetical protein [Caudoviricetes sp.]
MVNRNAPHYGDIVLNAIELLGKAKALLPTIRCRKTETSREMDHGEIKAYYILNFSL